MKTLKPILALVLGLVVLGIGASLVNGAQAADSALGSAFLPLILSVGLFANRKQDAI